MYNIICDSLGIEPKANNGTLRLPLKPVGLHSDEPGPETPADPPTTTKPANLEQGTGDGDEEVNKEASSSGENNVSNDDESDEDLKKFWSYMKAKMKAAMDWAHRVFTGLKESSKPPPDSAGDS